MNWRRVASWITAVVGTATVVTLVVVPVVGSRNAQQDLRELDAAIVTASVRQLTQAADIGGPVDLDMTVRRVPDFLVDPVRERRIAAALDHVEVAYPEPACLAISVNGILVHSSGTDEPLIPASVQKLLTALAVLDVMDANERFVTDVRSTAPVENGEIQGNLVMIGGGDPMLAQQVYADAYRRQPQLLTPIAELAERIAATGVTRIRGRVIVDDSRYDRVRVVESWPERYQAQFNAGPIGALTVNDGFAEWEPTRAYADDPAIYAGDVLARELLRIGVRVDGGTRRGEVTGAELPLASIESPTVGEIVQQMLRESDNNTAESLLKEVGLRVAGEGSTAAGAETVIEIAAAAGLDTSQLVVTDGSGLDRGNFVTCEVLLALLDHVGHDSIIGQGLAVAAETGTIGHRFGGSDVEGRLRAKTGLLNNVNGFAGWIEGDDGTVVNFVQLLNGIPLNSREGFELQEQLAAELADVTIDLTADDIARVAPMREDEPSE